MNNTQLKKEIMMRVRAVHMTRRLFRPLVIEVALFVVLFVTINFLISVPHVVANLSMIRAGEMGSYLLLSFLKTGVLVKATLLVSFVLLVLLVRDISRNIRSVSFIPAA